MSYWLFKSEAGSWSWEQQKAKGKEVVLPEEPKRPQVADLMEALKRSIEATKRGERPVDQGLQDWSKDRLLKTAAELDSGGRTKMTKGDLVKALLKAS